MKQVVEELSKLLLRAGKAGQADAQLLDDFVAHRNEAAFTALVDRHGPMVFGVCRRILQNVHDAEDAFQATFLVLARKVAVVPHEAVGGWLHRVAYRTAQEARTLRGRRRTREKQVEKIPDLEATADESLRDLRALLDQELHHLPDKYRLPVILCELEGQTRAEVARQLGVREGTLSSRLATAHKMLASRLSRHGLTLSAGMLATVISEQGAAACLLTPLVATTSKAAMLFAAGKAATSCKVALLVDGVLKTMLLTKLKIATFVVLAGLIATTAATTTYRTLAAEQPVAAKQKAPSTVREPLSVEQLAQSRAPADEPKTDELSPKQILGRMKSAYAGCMSYRDSGVVTILFVQATGNRTEERPFTTAFVRPDRFRYQYQAMVGNQQRRYIIWSNREEVQTWWDIRPGIEKPESLELALGGAAGVSGGSSITIPTLLGKAAGGVLTYIKDAKRAQDGKLDKIECFRIEGKYVNDPVVVWLDKKSYLVRRIDQQSKVADFRTETTTTYDPTINEKTTDKMLEFDPPVQKQPVAAQQETLPADPNAAEKDKGLPKKGTEKDFDNTPGWSWYGKPVPVERLGASGSSTDILGRGLSYIVEQGKNGELSVYLAFQPNKIALDYRPVVFDGERNRYELKPVSGSAGHKGIMLKGSRLNPLLLPAGAKVKYLGFEYRTP